MKASCGSSKEYIPKNPRRPRLLANLEKGERNTAGHRAPLLKPQGRGGGHLTGLLWSKGLKPQGLDEGKMEGEEGGWGKVYIAVDEKGNRS
ncbi:MAG: hypothetical protein QXR19_10645 [Candidatus Jordarchaeaceae archaeon]